MENIYPYVIEVKFNSGKKAYSFGTDILNWSSDDYCVVESLHGLEVAKVVSKARLIEGGDSKGELKAIVRKASEADKQAALANEVAANSAWKISEEIIAKLELDMKVINVSYNLDRTKILLVYVSEDRVDFRELLKELSSILHCRIELRQVGPRDKAKMIGGIGTCGNETCCSRFMKDFAVISINMAKNQLLALNIQKLSGQCGKLMCCLKNEDDIYSELRKGLPKMNSQIRYKDKTYRLTGLNLLTNQVKLDNREETIIITVDDLRVLVKEVIEVKVENDNDEKTAEFSE